MKFILPIIPKAQMRARHGRTKSGISITYKAEAQREAEAHLTGLLQAFRPPMPLEGPLGLGVKAYMPVSESWAKTKKAAAKAGNIRPTSKPDLDNLMKNIKDCMTAMHFWADDKQVVEYLPGTGKYYDDGKGPRWEIEIINTMQHQPATGPGKE